MNALPYVPPDEHADCEVLTCESCDTKGCECSGALSNCGGCDHPCMWFCDDCLQRGVL